VRCHAAPVVSYLGSQFDQTDYSATGLNLGQSGFWFANFGTSPLETLQPIGQNAVDNLPSWAQVDNDPTSPGFSWADGQNNSTTTSTGGNVGFDTLTLPDGTVGLSGQVIDSNEAGTQGQSSNILSSLVLGADVPRSFVLHVVVDNEDSATAAAVRRVKARLDDGTVAEIEADTGNGIDDTRNNIADVHSFLYEDIEPGHILRIQLRTSNTPGASALGSGMAGFMFDRPIPEPSSVGLLAVALLGLGGMWMRHNR
jgi:hypothetical protein